MPKIVWRKNFEIFRMPIFATGLAVYGAIKDSKKVVGKKILRDFLLVSEGYDLLAAYVPADQLRELIEAIVEKIKKEPDFISQVHQEGIKANTDFFVFSKKALEIDYKNLSDKDLAKLLNDIYEHHRKSNGRITMTTWFLDSDGEDFTKFLMSIVDSKLKTSKVKISAAEAFSILTTPDKPSLAMQEEIESLKILKLIFENKNANKLFSHKDIKYIEDNLSKIDNDLHDRIISHYKKWLWQPYTYIGPAYDLDYYITMWSGLIRQKADINKNLKKLENQIDNDKKIRKELIKDLDIKGKEKKYFDIAQEIIYLKAYRKDAWFFSHYLLGFLHKEIAKRLDLSVQQVRMMTFDEIPQALLKRTFSERTLNQRFKQNAYIFKDLKSKVYAGNDADSFLETQNIEKEADIELKSLSGTSAMVGTIKGLVKIINVPEEMHKMEEGDVMVATTTYPSLVPAMKKAAAIVTNDGGITCHAAIVARELKKPCVVGTKLATKVFKDGDMIMVDATKGVVEKLD